MTKAEAKQSMRDKTPIVDQHGRKHDPETGEYMDKEGAETPPEGAAEKKTGFYLGEDGEADPIKAAAGETPAAQVTTPEPEAPAAKPQAADQPPEAEAVAERPVSRVDVSADHPVSGMGQTVIETATEAQAEVVRALLNGTYARRQEVAGLEAEIAKRDETIAHMESRTAAQTKWEGTPEYTAAVERFHEIKDQVGAEAASEYWVGVQHSLEEMEKAEYATRMKQNEELANQRAGDSWRSQAFRNTAGLPPQIRELPQFNGYFKSALESFDAELKLGHHPDVVDQATMHRKFSLLFKQRLSRQPDVRAVITAAAEAKHKTAAAQAVSAEQAKVEKEAAGAAAVQEFKEGVADRRIENPTNPLGAMGPGAAGSAIPPEVDAKAAPETQMSAFELKKSLKDGARADARRHLPTR